MANTQSKEVTLAKRVQASKGLRYCPVVLSPNERAKPGLVIVNGQPERHSGDPQRLTNRHLNGFL